MHLNIIWKPTLAVFQGCSDVRPASGRQSWRFGAVRPYGGCVLLLGFLRYMFSTRGGAPVTNSNSRRAIFFHKCSAQARIFLYKCSAPQARNFFYPCSQKFTDFFCYLSLAQRRKASPSTARRGDLLAWLLRFGAQRIASRVAMDFSTASRVPPWASRDA